MAVVRNIGRVVTTERRLTVTGIIKPTTTTEHAVRSIGRTCRISLRSSLIVTIPVLTPFPDVTTHVENTKFIGTLFFDGMSFTT